MKTIEEIKLEWQCHNRDNGMSWNEVAELVNEVASLQSSEGEIRDDDMFIEANKEAVKYSMLKHGDEYSDPAFDRDVIETKIDFATGFVAGRSTPTEQPRESSDEKLNLLKAFRLWYDELSMEDEILVYGKWEEVFLSRTPTEQPKQEPSDVCPDCNGRGTRLLAHFAPRIHCDRCNGTGKIIANQ